MGTTNGFMHYKEHLTKFSVLHPLTQKLAALVARELFDIFMTFAAFHLFQSDNGEKLIISKWKYDVKKEN